MGCCCGADDDVVETITSIEKENRPCTDVLGLLMFLAAIAFSVLIFLYAIQQGANPSNLIRGTDPWGNLCGGPNASTRPLAAWPNPAYYSVMICVASCNETKAIDGYMIIPYETQQVLYYCLPTTAAAAALQNNVVTSSFSGPAQAVSRVIGDLQIVWPVLAGAGGAAMLVSLLYVWLLKAAAGLLVWGSVLTILGASAAFAWFLINASTTQTSSDMQMALQICGYVVAGFAFIFFCVIVFLRDRIRIAIQVSKEAASAVVEMPSMQLFPILPFIGLVIYVAYWIVSCIYIASVTSTTSVALETGLTQYNPFGKSLPNPRLQTGTNQTFQYLLAYQFFHLLWSVAFLQYFSFLVIAGAVADWYFTPFTVDSTKERGDEAGQLTNWPVLASFFRSLKHLGTVAVCSLIIAIIEFIRAAIAYVQAKTEGMGEDNPVTKYTRACIFCLLQCFFKCLECCLDKINKNGLIMTAITGDNFCGGACASFKLVWNNIARVAAISLVGTCLISVGQVLVAVTCAAGAAAVLLYVETYSTQVSSIVLPVLLVMILAYYAASIFLSIFDAAVDTIFICFLLDEEKNGNSGRMLASRNLQDIIGAVSVETKSGGEAEMAKD